MSTRKENMRSSLVEQEANRLFKRFINDSASVAHEKARTVSELEMTAKNEWEFNFLMSVADRCIELMQIRLEEFDAKLNKQTHNHD